MMNFQRNPKKTVLTLGGSDDLQPSIFPKFTPNRDKENTVNYQTTGCQENSGNGDVDIYALVLKPLLKVIGATPSQIRRVIRRESFQLSVWSIPFGLLIGAAVGFISNMTYWSWLGNLPAAIGVLIFTILKIVGTIKYPIFRDVVFC